MEAPKRKSVEAGTQPGFERPSTDDDSPTLLHFHAYTLPRGAPPPELLLYGPAPLGDAVPRPLTFAALDQKHGSEEDFMAVFRTSAYYAYRVNSPAILQKTGSVPLPPSAAS